MKKLLFLINVPLLVLFLTSCPARPSQKATTKGDTLTDANENRRDSTDSTSVVEDEAVLSGEVNSVSPSSERTVGGQNSNRQEAPRHNSFDQDIIDSIKNNTKKE